jgi:hydroxyacylglutathione hydrolase
MRRLVTALVFLCVCLAWPGAQAAEKAGIKDAESATHGFEAALCQPENTYEFAGYRIVQFNLPVLSHYSYMIISGEEALVVDPDRDVSPYLEHAKKEGVAIRGVLLTHSHADFVAGHLELVKAVGCPIHQNASSGAKYPFEPLTDGSTVTVGTVTVRALETPGHTPDGMCGAVYGGGLSAPPDALLSGDTLFVGSVGRPDLLEGTMSAAQLASMGFDTWHNKLAGLGDAVVVLPAHGAGSLCGAHLSDEPSTTIGQEKVSNPYTQKKSRTEFVAAVLQDLSDPPQYFGHNARMNREGPPLVDWEAPLPKEIPAEKSLSDTGKYAVVDIRDSGEYAAKHIPNAVNIGLRGRLETWVGIMIPWGAKLVLAGSPDELSEAVARLHRVGYEASVITMDSWNAAGLPTAENIRVNPLDLYEQMQKGEAPIIVDVRLPNEWMAVRIGTVVNLPLNKLAALSAKLDPTEPVVTVCNSAFRSSMAVGVLEGKGFTKASSLEGGSEAWINAGLPVFGSDQQPAHGAPAAAKREVRLAERIAPEALHQLMVDLPGTFDLVDIRPPAAFQDYSLPNSRNVDIADLMENPAYLTGVGPLIIVDRDGSLAMMVGGVLSQKTHRQVKVLQGGLDRYWQESELGSAVATVPLPPPSSQGAAPPTQMPQSAPAPSAQPPLQQPAATKKKSAGC